MQSIGEYPVQCVNGAEEEILLLLSVFGGVVLSADGRGVAAEASRLRAPLLALRDSLISERNAGTTLAQLCMGEGCYEEIFLGLEFSRFARPTLLELVRSCRRPRFLCEHGFVEMTIDCG